jgi:hypothetical protein
MGNTSPKKTHIVEHYYNYLPELIIENNHKKNNIVSMINISNIQL